MGTKSVLDEATVDTEIGEDAVLGVDEKTLPADGTAYV
jgi:hypothetical protein